MNAFPPQIKRLKIKNSTRWPRLSYRSITDRPNTHSTTAGYPLLVSPTMNAVRLISYSPALGRLQEHTLVKRRRRPAFLQLLAFSKTAAAASGTAIYNTQLVKRRRRAAPHK